MDVDLGPVDRFTRLPALVEIGQGFFYLVREGDGFVLLSSLCPHAGGEVVWQDEDGEFVCPVHGWRFDADGRCGDSPGAALKAYPVEQRGENLVAKFA